MIFSFNLLFVSLVGLVCCCIFICDDPDFNLFFGILFAGILVCCLLVLLICPIDSKETRNVVLKMRTEPQNFSIQDASEINIKLVKIDRWKDTIFTFYKGFDTTPLDLNKFVKI